MGHNVPPPPALNRVKREYLGHTHCHMEPDFRSVIRVHAGLYFGEYWMLIDCRMPIRFHVGTTQVDFEVDRPPPAKSPPGRSFDHHGNGNGNFCPKNGFRKMKKKPYLSYA